MRWRVRPYDNSDYAAIIEVQTDSFHTANPVPFLNQLTYNNFRAEVVDALRQKTKYGDASTFQLLVAEDVPALARTASQDPFSGATPSDSSSSSSSSPSQSLRESLVGAVEVSIMRDWVLRSLPRQSGLTLPLDEYAYISSMCVRTSQRRRGVAQALMAAAEAQARLWRQPHLALHVYKDNVPAVELYRRCGMRVIAEDPGWKALLGGRVRLLMYKELPLEDEGWESADGGEDS
jgi:ribosomal protein S18 acetylase RimI-like enzyme